MIDEHTASHSTKKKERNFLLYQKQFDSVRL